MNAVKLKLELGKRKVFVKYVDWASLHFWRNLYVPKTFVDGIQIQKHGILVLTCYIKERYETDSL